MIDADNTQLGIVSFSEAIERAREAGKDLVLVAPNSNPVVCRIMNFGKFIYQKNKQIRDQRKKQVVRKLKEVKFHANIDEHDYQVKLNHIIEFLKKGNRVKVSLFFRGREMIHRDSGRALLERVIEAIGEYGTVDAPPRLAGRNMSMQLAPVSGSHK